MDIMSDLKTKTSSGIIWNFTEKFLSRGFGVLVTLVLAWFLTPEDYGVIAMIAVFIALSQALVDGGLGQALIRKTNASQVDFDTVFYTNIILSILIYIVLFFSAPFIASFYESPILIDIIRVSSLAIFANSLVVVQQAILQKKMLFKKQLQVQLPATLLSGTIALVLAYLEFAVWALVVQMVLNAFFIAFFYWNLKLWRPSKKFSFKSLKELFAFSSFLVMESVLSVPFKNMYNIILPKFFATSVVGLYFFADKLKDLILQQLVQAIVTVTYPALSTIQNDKLRLKNAFRKVISMMSFLVTPFLLVLAALASPLFETLFPTNWIEAVPYVQLLCIGALLNPLAVININIMKVVGKSHLIFYVGLYKKIVGVSIFAMALTFNDILIVLYGQIIFSILAYIPNSYYSSKLINYGVVEQFLDFSPSLFVSSVVGIIIYSLQIYLQWNAWIELVSLSILAIVLYLAMSHIFKLKAYVLIKELVRSKVNAI